MQTRTRIVVGVLPLILAARPSLIETSPATAEPGTPAQAAVVRIQRLAGQDGVVLTESALLLTRDAGRSFENVSPPGSLEGIGDAFFLSAERGFLAGWTPAAPDRLRLLRSVDGGRSWQDTSVAQSLLEPGARYASAQVHFTDALNGYLLGRRATSAAFSVGELLRTRDGGASWQRLPAPPVAGRLVFADAERGFLTDAPISEALYRTLDGGQTWRRLRLPLAPRPGRALFALPRFSTKEQGTLTVTLRGAQPRIVTYTTDDGGRSWRSVATTPLPAGGGEGVVPAAVRSDGRLLAFATRATLHFDPTGTPRRLSLPKAGARSPSGLRSEEGASTSADVRELDLDDAGDGWALVGDGVCDAAGCRQITQLLAVDGALGETRELLSRALPVTAADKADLRATATISSALGFDKCSAGTVSQMQTWWTSSPFRDANVYIGGVSRGCAQPGLDAAWVSSVFGQGWRLIPTWVGPQAPCTSFRSRISADAVVARSQGLAEADAAQAAAAALGLGPGSPIYYDLEAYSGGGACSLAVRAFVDAWTERLHAKGYLAGVYGLPRNAQADWRSGVLAQPPDAVWLAYYACTGASCGWTPRVLDIPGLDNAYWPRDQRLVQYWNSHTETWGGVSFTIDRNIAQGPVAAPQASLPDVVVESLSVSPASPLAGQATSFAAVVRNVGGAATPAGVSVGVGYRVDGTQVTWGAVEGPLAPGASVTIGTQGGSWLAAAGAHTLVAVVDDVDRFPESDETNNQASTSFVVSDPCLEDVPSGRWKGEYFANPTLSGSPVLVMDHGEALALDWGASSPSPACGLPADGFSARFTRLLDSAAGRYRFSVTADDGVRLRLDSSLLLDEWRDQVATFTRDVSLSAGPHTLLVEHYENQGAARIEVGWRPLEPVIVDDGDTGMALLETATGRREWWHRESGLGWGGDMVWTTNTLGRKDNYARWTPVLPAPGRYQVEAFVPRNHASTTRASYSIVAAGKTSLRTLNQAPLYDVWADLGSYDFSAGGGEYVELGDVTGEASNSKQIAFDAIRFTPVASEPPPSAAGWAFPVGSADSGAGWRVTLSLGQSWVGSGGKAYSGHLAEDWARVAGSSLGQPVYAAADGEVVTVVQNCGNYVDVVVLQHEAPDLGEPVYSMYGHIETTLKLGDRVRRRDPIGVIGDPVTFGPHLHFEIKNRTALVSPPLSSCANVARQLYVSAGYSGRANDYAGGAFYDPTDAVVGNRYYHPTRFIGQRLAAGAAALRARQPLAALEPGEGDGLPRCERPE